MGAIRLFLAIAVLQSHIGSHVLRPAHLFAGNTIVLGMNGGYAVMFFFVVSGFLISFVLEQKYDRPGGIWDFYRARALRIYPLWWSLYLIVPFVTAEGIWTFATQRHAYDLLTGFFIYGSDWLLSFWTYPTAYTAMMPHGLELGWTLASEMTFYLLAPFIFRSRMLPWLVLGASLMTRLVLVRLHPQQIPESGWENFCYYFLPTTIMFFMLGHLARQLYATFRLRERAAWGVLGAAALICLLQDGTFDFDNLGFYLSISLFALALPAVFSATKDNGICNFLGDLTYPLYLTQVVILVLVETPGTFLNEMTRQLVSFVSAVPISGGIGVRAKVAMISLAFWPFALLVAATTHFLIERPATACMRVALTFSLSRRAEPSRQATM